MLDVTRHLGLARAFARRHVSTYGGDYYEALSACYEALMRAAQTYDGSFEFSTYYWFWARKYCLKRDKPLTSLDHDVAADPPTDAYDSYELLRVLDARSKVVVLLTVVDGHTLRYVAEILGISTARVGVLRKIALETMREHYEFLENEFNGVASDSNSRPDRGRQYTRRKSA